MRLLEVERVEHKIRVSMACDYIEPNCTEDTIFTENGIPFGFYIKDLSKYDERIVKLVNVANNEFRSDNVPKSMLARMSVFKADGINKANELGLTRNEVMSLGVTQWSTIIGSIPPKEAFRRYTPNFSSVHSNEKAQIFIKSMLLLADASEKIIKDILPDVWEKQNEIFKKVDKKWKFGNLWTSSISNYNISAPFHRDTGNMIDCVNVIITKRWASKGGNLHVPDYGLTIDSADNSMLVYPAWKNIHGVTPIIPLREGGYRNSFIFYPLKAFLKENITIENE